jgi:adenylate kinase family enzyme
VVDGNYGTVRELVWSRATHLVWLDYPRGIIMARVIRRSLSRVIRRTRLWSGNTESWSHLLRPSHPIRWAWTTWRRRRADIEALIQREEHAGLTVLRLRRPHQVSSILPTLLNR